MNKTHLKIIPSVDTSDLVRFIRVNSTYNWNESCDILSQELNFIVDALPEQIETEVEYTIYKVIISKLKHKGWIKLFTDTQEISQDYYILFTD